MHRKFLFISMAILSLTITVNGALGADDNSAQETTINIQGKWSSLWTNAVSCKIGDKLVVQFKGDQIYISDERSANPVGAQFKLIPSDVPGEGSINMIDPATKTVSKGLYKLKRDTLVLFLGASGKPRPKTINTYVQEDKESWLLVLVREKLKPSRE